ncbi:Uncharacterised protein [Mycobacteroides abscessus]|nr:Uncharacterised protein [Mycobacteroides abscessus]
MYGVGSRSLTLLVCRRSAYDVRVLRSKALTSLRTGIAAFNGLDDDGRVTTVLLSVQHAFEMLLKVILVAKKDKTVFDKRSQQSISLEGAIRRCQQWEGAKLSDAEAGTIRTLDALRDAEQYWHLVVDDGLLYLNIRAAVTLFDDLLGRVFDQRLGELLPARVVPVSSEPPQSLDLLVDREYQRIAELLKPGRRATGEGMARIRSLLATEALADPDAAEISEADVRRVARGIREGKLREQVFPKLSGLTTDIQGAGLTVEVRMVKSDGLPVTYTNDPTVDSSAIRMIDLERKFHLGTYELADAADVSRSKAIALRRHLGLDADDGHYSHAFVFGRSKHLRYSDNAVRAMKKSLEVVDLGRDGMLTERLRTTNWTTGQSVINLAARRRRNLAASGRLG